MRDAERLSERAPEKVMRQSELVGNELREIESKNSIRQETGQESNRNDDTEHFTNGLSIVRTLFTDNKKFVDATSKTECDGPAVTITSDRDAWRWN